MLHPQTRLYRSRVRSRRTPPLTNLRRGTEMGEDGLGVAAGEGVGVVGTHDFLRAGLAF